MYVRVCVLGRGGVCKCVCVCVCVCVGLEFCVHWYVQGAAERCAEASLSSQYSLVDACSIEHASVQTPSQQWMTVLSPRAPIVFLTQQP